MINRPYTINNTLFIESVVRKSTLLNHLFHTNFKEMDASEGRNRTTQGVWFSQAEGIEPCTLVMDLEGTDGRERGEDDTSFERRSALFALAVSDILLINMWCHDIGRQQAANKPLLKTLFEVMMKLNLSSPRKTTLLLVIRDKTKTPLERLEPLLREDIQKIWESIQKPAEIPLGASILNPAETPLGASIPNPAETPLGAFFNVEITALPHYEFEEKDFEEQVSSLRERFFNSIKPGGLAGDRREVVPASDFPFRTKEIWKIIKENKDLDLSAIKKENRPNFFYATVAAAIVGAAVGYTSATVPITVMSSVVAAAAVEPVRMGVTSGIRQLAAASVKPVAMGVIAGIKQWMKF